MNQSFSSGGERAESNPVSVVTLCSCKESKTEKIEISLEPETATHVVAHAATSFSLGQESNVPQTRHCVQYEGNKFSRYLCRRRMRTTGWNPRRSCCRSPHRSTHPGRHRRTRLGGGGCDRGRRPATPA